MGPFQVQAPIDTTNSMERWNNWNSSPNSHFLGGLWQKSPNCSVKLDPQKAPFFWLCTVFSGSKAIKRGSFGGPGTQKWPPNPKSTIKSVALLGTLQWNCCLFKTRGDFFFMLSSLLMSACLPCGVKIPEKNMETTKMRISSWAFLRRLESRELPSPLARCSRSARSSGFSLLIWPQKGGYP